MSSDNEVKVAASGDANEVLRELFSRMEANVQERFNGFSANMSKIQSEVAEINDSVRYLESRNAYVERTMDMAKFDNDAADQLFNSQVKAPKIHVLNRTEVNGATASYIPPVDVEDSEALDKLTQEDISFQLDQTKIMVRHNDIKKEWDENWLTRRLEVLSSRADDGTKSFVPKDQRAGWAANALKSWMNSNAVLYDNHQSFESWRRGCIAYHSAVGLNVLSYMSPWDAPKSLDDWADLDTKAYKNEYFKKFVENFKKLGVAYPTPSKSDSFEKLNTAFIVTLGLTPGLAESLANCMENTIDFDTMKDCLLTAEDSSKSCASREIYYRVIRYFMLNTDRTRLQRLSFITNELHLRNNESIKSFATRLKREAEVLNSMNQGDTIVPSALLLTILQREVENMYKQEPMYDITKVSLKSRNPKYKLEDLAQEWEVVWQDERAKRGFAIETSYVAEGSSNFESANFAKKGANQNFHGEKKKLEKDANGRLICWQFAKKGECSFGKDCKFSHSCERKQILAMFTTDEIAERIIEQVNLVSKRFKGKRNDSRPRSTSRRRSFSRGRSNSSHTKYKHTGRGRHRSSSRSRSRDRRHSSGKGKDSKKVYAAVENFEDAVGKYKQTNDESKRKSKNDSKGKQIKEKANIANEDSSDSLSSNESDDSCKYSSSSYE